MWCVVYVTPMGRAVAAVFGPYRTEKEAQREFQSMRKVTLVNVPCEPVVFEMTGVPVNFAGQPPTAPSECPRCSRVEAFVAQEFALYTSEEMEDTAQVIERELERVASALEDKILTALDKRVGKGPVS